MAGEDFGELNSARASRAGAWILLFVGLFGVGFGFWHWRGTVVDGFTKKTESFKTLDQIEEERLAGLKAKDTDGDVINDFDETYVYHTSPYLKDSDSDGVDDKTELARGKNPNCPEGRDCGPLGAGFVPTSAATGTDDIGDGSAETKALESLLNPTPDQVRAFLREAGVSEDELAMIDDGALMEMYQQALLEARQNQGAKAP